MTDDVPPTTPETNAETGSGDRIAKVMARAGVASRREAERMILEGRVLVNGKKVDSPALDVLPEDRITVDGKRLEEPQETKLWLYYKPLGLVTTESDEKGRQTVFDALPRDLPRVMTVGRLDLNSEGLLLLTNDGELKRRLELPTTGWLRRYRVRVNGTPNDLTFGPLRRGVVIDGEEFAPMEINLDSQQGANAWLTVGIREGKNREIRRAMSHVGLIVNRLIRIGYGPFKLTGLEPNEVREIKRKVLRDQLGGLLTGDPDEKPRDFRERGAGRREDEGRDQRPRPSRPLREDGERKPFKRREGDDRKPFARREDGDRKPFARREDGERKPFARREDGERKPFQRREDGDRKPYARREDGEKRPFGKGGDKPFARREDGDRKPFQRREDGDRKPYVRREDGEKRPFSKGGDKPFARREDGERKPFQRREDGDRKPYARREDGEKRSFGKSGDKPFARREDGERKPFQRREDGDRPAGPRGDKPFHKREDGDRKPFARRDSGDKPFGKREDGDRKPFQPRDGFKSGAKPAGKPGGKAGPGAGPRPGGKPGPRFGGKPGGDRGPRRG